MRLLSRFVKSRPVSLLFSFGFIRNLLTRHRRDRFERQFAQGRWDSLGDTTEVARYGVISGYIHRFAPAGALLDLGCGQGVLASYLIQPVAVRYCGVDYSENAIKQATARNISTFAFQTGDIDAFSDNRKYNAIIFNESLYYLPRPLATLERYKDLLAEDGVFVISIHAIPDHDGLWDAVNKQCRCLDYTVITNNKGTSWRCGVFIPSPA